jgi:eukaryotic-like serine/threonine-protein kinase
MEQATVSSRVERHGFPVAVPFGGGDDVAPREEATCAGPVRVRTATELGLDSWQSSFKGTPEQAQLVLDLHRSDPQAAHRLAEAVTTLPEVGTELLGFRLLSELGKGAFGRVLLAQQGDLANRHVVLKVSPNIDDESRVLARLQHTNIVPIYSVHRAGALQAVCMPYFGATTLADVIKEIRGRAALPQSGADLVSTIFGRKSTIQDLGSGSDGGLGVFRDSVEASPSGQPAGLATVPAGGSTANLELLQGLSYVEAVLWIGSRLAEGLAHAHERGIVHRDLKPANVLLTDEGQPMLLDFNLAQDTKLSGSATAAYVGGTLPFMAPEQLQAYRTQKYLVEFTSDLYSLGVILYELLTGRRPFPPHSGPVKEILEKMIEDRQGPPPAIRCWNKAVSPAVESIVRHCLEPDPSKRYQTARQLKEDIDRHLENLPLRYAPEPSVRERARKWVRRHPKLASTTTVAVVTGVLIAGLVGLLVVRGQRLARLEARESLGRFLDDKKAVQYLLTTRTNDAAQLESGVRLGREALKSYGVLDNPGWQEQPAVQRLPPEGQAQLRQSAGEMLVLLAQGVALQAENQGNAAERDKLLAQAMRLNELAEAACGTAQSSRALWQQRAELAHQLGRIADAKELQARAAGMPLRTSADRYLVAAEYLARGNLHQALPLLTEATERDPQDFWAWFLLGVCHDGLSDSAEAVACYNTCVALTPTSPWAYLNRGLAQLRQHHYRQASADLDQALALRPDLAEAYRNRALARQGLKQYAEAERDLTRALELGASPVQVYFLRADVRARAGDLEGAKRDRAEGLRWQPTDEMGWLSRGYARLTYDLEGALGDLDEALKLNPRSLSGLQNKAHVLSKLGRNEEAARVLDKAVALYPDFIPARAGRGVLRARLGDRAGAHRDAEDCLARDTKPLTLYQLAGVYALTSRQNPDDRREAFRLLSAALQRGCGFDLLEGDKDLDPIRACPEFRKLVDAAGAIRATAMHTPTKR